MFELYSDRVRQIIFVGRQAGGDGEGKRRAEEDAKVNSEWARMKLVHSVQSESRPQAQPSSGRGPQFLFDRPARESPHVPVQNSPVGPPRASIESGVS